MATERDTTVERDVGRLGAFRAVERALGHEAHVLAERPELTWQQLHNRLQREGEPVPRVPEPELRRRSTRRAHPWWRSRTRLRESEALIRVFAGHAGISGVLGCVVNPDGTWIVSASHDKTLKICEVAPGILVCASQAPPN